MLSRAPAFPRNSKLAYQLMQNTQAGMLIWGSRGTAPGRPAEALAGEAAPESAAAADVATDRDVGEMAVADPASPIVEEVAV